MIICACSFTQNGNLLLSRLKAEMPEITWLVRSAEENLKSWAKSAFEKHLPLLFVGAAGIAVRTIADFVSSKLEDSPVLVVDELGRFVVPLLSGHMGGANDIAELIAVRLGAQSVITTATDVEDKFAVDVFARNNGLKIVNKDGIKAISAKVLKNEKLTVWVNPEICIKDKNLPDCLSLIMEKTKPAYVDILIDLPRSVPLNKEDCTLLLVPRLYCVGMGCKKDKSFEELRGFLTANFDKTELLYAVASIDIKQNEIGLMTLAQFYHVPFVTFSAEELKLAEGSFSESEFVEKTTGVSNVCERAAVLCAGADARLVLAKTAHDGMTLAVAERKPVIADWGCGRK